MHWISQAPPPPPATTTSPSRAPRDTVTKLLVLAAWFGLLTGFVEVLMRLAGKLILAKTVHFDADLIWMAPAADVILFVVFAICAIGVARAIAPNKTRFAVVCVSATLLVLTILYSYPRIHWLAGLVLALGVGVQSARMMNTRGGALLNVAQRSLPLMAAAMLAVAVLIAGERLVRERNAFAKLPVARAGAPNIVLIILDTVRAADLSAYGYLRPTTPNLQKFARTGVQFDRAFVTAPWTLPSHGSIFTGRYAYELSTDWERALDASPPTLAEVLRSRGYRTAGFNANYLYGGAEFGLARGFIHYEDYPTNFGQLLSTSKIARLLNGFSNRLFRTYRTLGRKNAESITQAAAEWMEKTREPFFVFLNYFDAHEPYAPPAPYDLMYTQGRPSTRHVFTGKQHTAAQIRDLRDSYNGAIAYVDGEIGRLMEVLDRAGLRDNTVIIITSDHGEEFGEHGYMSHGNGLYAQSLHVPLLISYPRGAPANMRVRTAVTLRDVPATIVDLAGFSDAKLPGNSLAPYWNGNAGLEGMPSPVLSELSFVSNQPSWYPVAGGAMQSIILGSHHYIARADGREELYHLDWDPAEHTNLANSAAHAPTLQKLRAALRSSRPAQ
jgi:arylsulfatase A-like enzyme